MRTRRLCVHVRRFDHASCGSTSNQSRRRLNRVNDLALDAAHLAPLDPRVYGGSIDTDKGTYRCVQRGTKGTGLGEDIAAKGTKGGVGQTASALEGGALRWRLKFAEDDVPIAERFRRAYLEVDAERAARREKNSQKRKNRNLNRMFTSSSERHIYRALDDISLVDGY